MNEPATNADLSVLLAAWPHDPDHNLRVITASDGRKVLQVRTELGIEQIELDGRPDRGHPHGVESELVYQEQRWAAARAVGAEFSLNESECEALFDEGRLYYQRYLRLFELEDWPRTLRDTARNLRLFDFVHRHAAREEDRQNLEKWRPYVLRMNGAAAVLQAVAAADFDEALRLTQQAIDRIRKLPELEDSVFEFERARSLDTLEKLGRQVYRTRPAARQEQLESELAKAIEQQEFEQAARLRDELRALRGETPGPLPPDRPLAPPESP